MSHVSTFALSLNSARASLLRMCTIAVLGRLLLAAGAVIGLFCASRKNEEVFPPLAVWGTMIILQMVVAVLFLSVWYATIKPFETFLIKFVRQTNKLPCMQIQVAITWMRTQVWYFAVVHVLQSVVFSSMCVVMHMHNRVSVRALVAGDTAMTLGVTLGAFVTTLVTYHETKYKATEHVHLQ